MSKWIIIALLFVFAGGAALAAHLDTLNDHPYFACAGQRVAVFGYGNRAGPVAEMAAIIRWSQEAEKKFGKSFGDWAMAQDRFVQCRRWRNTPYHQCRIAALPCKPKETDT